MKIKSLEVVNFRNIENETIEFGEYITVIAGQNGTSKTSLLGWIAQAFNYSGKEKTITGADYKTQFSKIFKFCKRNDYIKTYEVNLNYLLDETQQKKLKMNTALVKETKQTEQRYRVIYDKKKGKAIDYPIIFLGLSRLVPLAFIVNSNSTIKKDAGITNEEKEEYKRIVKNIFAITNNEITPSKINLKSKKHLLISTNKYNHWGNSAGEDNVGQIVTAILSLKKIKKGILLIDEIDATLFASAQINLIKELVCFSRKNGIQVVFTTHSLEIIEYFYKELSYNNKHNNSNGKNNIKINYFEKKDNKVCNKANIPFMAIKEDITLKKGNKIKLFCEDDFAKKWCESLLEKDNHDVVSTQLSWQELLKLDKKGIIENTIILLDGDVKKEKIYQDHIKEKFRNKIITLPGDLFPEKVFYDFLKKCSDGDLSNNGLKKQEIFNNYINIDKDDIEIKNWAKKRIFDNDVFFNLWGDKNIEAKERFNKEVSLINP